MQVFRKGYYQEYVFVTVSFFGFSSKHDTASLLRVQLSVCINSILKEVIKQLGSCLHCFIELIIGKRHLIASSIPLVTQGMFV